MRSFTWTEAAKVPVAILWNLILHTQLSTFLFIIFIINYEMLQKVFSMSFPDVYLKIFHIDLCYAHRTEIQYLSIIESLLNIYFKKVNI